MAAKLKPLRLVEATTSRDDNPGCRLANETDNESDNATGNATGNVTGDATAGAAGDSGTRRPGQEPRSRHELTRGPDLVAIYESFSVAYEEAAALDDWTVLEDFFTTDIIFVSHGEPFANATQGIDDVLAYLRSRMEGFGLRFDERMVIRRLGPERKGNQVYLRWAGLYRSLGAPTLRIEGSSTVSFQGRLISRVDETISHQSAARVKRWLARYSDHMLPTPGGLIREILGEARRKNVH